MKLVTCICDRCKLEIEGDSIAINPIWQSPLGVKKGYVFEDSTKREYCTECAEKIYKFMQTAPVVKQKREIDKGKIVALRQAGWSLDKIADEVGCSVFTCRSVLGLIKKESKTP